MSTRTFSLFFLYDTATTEIYTLSLHDALPIFALGDFPDLPRKILKAFHKIVAGVPAVYGDEVDAVIQLPCESPFAFIPCLKLRAIALRRPAQHLIAERGGADFVLLGGACDGRQFRSGERCRRKNYQRYGYCGEAAR